MRRASIATALLVGLLGPVAASGADKVFVGYVYGSTRGINYKLYTHLFHAFLIPNADGSLKPEDGVPNREFVAEAHKASVKVFVSLGGWGWDKQFAAIASTVESEDRFNKAVMAIVDEADYDGLDLDWEYPDTKDDIVGFERMVRRFRLELDKLGARKGRHLGLTMAASSDPGTLSWLGKDFLLETMDWVNVMTYDYAGDWSNYAGHNAPLFASSKAPGGRGPSVERTMKYLVEERGMPADRLAVGIPLYGRGFAVKEPYASTKGKPKARIPGGGDYRNLKRLQGEGWTRTWDDETRTPWLAAPDKSVVIGYDDAESVGIKADWAMKGGYRGVFFWEVGNDRMDDGTHPLQEAVRREWDKAVKPSSPR